MREPTIKGNASGAEGGGRRGGSSPKPDVENTSADAVDDKLRPQRLSRDDRPRAVAQRLAISLAAAQKRGEALPHILFDGPPGLGKTTFATVLHNELGVELNITSGAALDKKMDVMPFLTNASEGSILFIDEIHRLPAPSRSSSIRSWKTSGSTSCSAKGCRRAPSISHSRSSRSSAPRRGAACFPLRSESDSGCTSTSSSTTSTTWPGSSRSMPPSCTHLVDEAAWELAARSRGTPCASPTRSSAWVRDYALARADGHISLSVVRDALDMQEVDSEGLDKQDRRYLETLIRVFAGGPTGVEALAATMNVSVDTLKDEVEPYLLRASMSCRAPRGRQVTAAAYLHLGLPEPLPSPSCPFRVSAPALRVTPRIGGRACWTSSIVITLRAFSPAVGSPEQAIANRRPLGQVWRHDHDDRVQPEQVVSVQGLVEKSRGDLWRFQVDLPGGRGNAGAELLSKDDRRDVWRVPICSSSASASARYVVVAGA